MDLNKTEKLTEAAHDTVESRLGNGQFFGIIPGTAWKQGLDGLFQQTDEIPYEDLGVPMVKCDIEGHSKSLKIGTINGRDTVLLGRVHTNEEPRHPDLPQSMRIVVGALRDRLDGLLVTNGVGTLHGPVGLERGRLHSLLQTAALDTLGWCFRGHPKQEINVGDLTLVTDVNTISLGAHTPLLGGEFEDALSMPPGNKRGIHRDNDFFFNIARNAITEVQGRCPLATYCFIDGPGFEGPTVKRIFRALGGDIAGMSGQEIWLTTKWDIPFANLGFATNGPFVAHEHEDNAAAGEQGAQKAGRAIEVLAHTWPKKGI